MDRPIDGHSQRRWRIRRLRQATQFARGITLTATRWLAQQEAAVLVTVLGGLLALFGFVKIAEELGEGELANFDEWLLSLLRVPGQPHIPIGPPGLLEPAKDITALGGHDPTDVLFVWCAGLVWALICWLAARYLQKRGAVEKPGRS